MKVSRRRLLAAPALAAALIATGADTAAVAAAPGPRMAGAGWVGIGNPEIKVHFKVSLACPTPEVELKPHPEAPGREGAILELRSAAGAFLLDALEAASCSNNLHQGRGVGSCNGEGGFIIDWRITDGALGGPDTRPDAVVVDIDGDGRACALALAGPLGGGNVRMDPTNASPAVDPSDPDKRIQGAK
jgi:hypothetical protein